MTATVDWTGLAAVIAAVGAAVAAVISALASARLQRPVDEVHAAVTTPPDSPSIGQVVADIREAQGPTNGGQ